MKMVKDKVLNIILMNEAVKSWDGSDVTELMSQYGKLKRFSQGRMK